MPPCAQPSFSKPEQPSEAFDRSSLAFKIKVLLHSEFLQVKLLTWFCWEYPAVFVCLYPQMFQHFQYVTRIKALCWVSQLVFINRKTKNSNHLHQLDDVEAHLLSPGVYCEAHMLHGCEDLHFLRECKHEILVVIWILLIGVEPQFNVNRAAEKRVKIPKRPLLTSIQMFD